MQPIHERMPVIIPPEQYGLWLDPRCQDTEKLARLLRPLAEEKDPGPQSRVCQGHGWSSPCGCLGSGQGALGSSYPSPVRRQSPSTRMNSSGSPIPTAARNM
jgi:hypothetical protein